MKKVLTYLTATAALLALLVPATAAKAAQTTDAPTTDAITNLLSEYSDYWKAGEGVQQSDEAEKVLQHNDALTEEINNKAATETADKTNDQQARAVLDAQMSSEATLHDALGPILGAYYENGINGGKLPLTKAFLSAMNATASTGTAKNYYSYPRPYIDRPNYLGESLNMGELKSTLNIQQVQAYVDQGQYVGLAASGSFPSGHTTFAFTQGAGLATILPEFGTQIMTRVSEAGNNRIVLGVHYPLDIMGGHIAGQYGVATALSDPTVASQAAARTELVNYLTDECAANNYGSTLSACIGKTGATSTNEYSNSFTDDVVSAPVNSPSSAVAAYTARMSYGFQSDASQKASVQVPSAAINLLRNVPAYKGLNDTQLKQILAMTENTRVYPLESSAQGWGQINLAAAYSAKVTLSADGTVQSVAAGQSAASVVRQQTNDSDGNQGGSGTNDGSGTSNAKGGTSNSTSGTSSKTASNAKKSATTAKKPQPIASVSGQGVVDASGKNASLAKTGSNVGLVVSIAAMLAVAGSAVSLTVMRMKRGH
ncbi:MAG: phosphatase PAP2 family protein [Bifidobacterium sp.]|uniref:Phosphatase PAP2 family protein n=2 Tax=Bifidobacterium TaxID=1678 RepID=A0AB39UGA0_9BIFI